MGRDMCKWSTLQRIAQHTIEIFELKILLRSSIHNIRAFVHLIRSDRTDEKFVYIRPHNMEIHRVHISNP